MPEPLITLDRVRRSVSSNGRELVIVDDLTLEIGEGEVVCLVGESGCGKTTTGKLFAGLIAPTAGRVLFHGQDVRKLRGSDRKAYRLGVQLVHQDPFSSLNPTQRVWDILAAPLRRHRITRGEKATRERMRSLLAAVELTQADDILAKFPHQLSGGQRQRVAIARALTVQPKFIVADEAVSMVDVSIRVSILNTLRRLREDMGLAMLFITHDLALARYFAGSGQIAVMYLGSLVEIAPAADLVARLHHPYSQALLAAVPRGPSDRVPDAVPLTLRDAEVPSLLARPAGCPFHPRCPLFEPGHCDVVRPALTALRTGGRAACHPVIRELGLEAPEPHLPAAQEEARELTSVRSVSQA